ncbi:hypothetical protein JCM3765_000990 [Sporobolomyces pararoseus]
MSLIPSSPLCRRLISSRNLVGATRSASNRSPSSSVWLQRQQNDPFVRQRQAANAFVSRSAFKLLELNEKVDLLRPGINLVDLGAAPGGWIQAAESILDGSGTIVGVDLLPLKLSKIASNTERIGFVKGDFLDPVTQSKLRKTLAKVTGKENPRVDLVLSDMMANTTGSSFRDATLSLTLCESALSFALQHLSPSSSSSETYSRSSTRIQLVVKHFNSHHTKEFTERLRKYFLVVRWIKPESSRKESKEGFLVRPVHIHARPLYQSLPHLEHLQNRINHASTLLEAIDGSNRHRSVKETKDLAGTLEKEYEGLKREKENLTGSTKLSWRSEIVRAVEIGKDWFDMSEESADGQRKETVRKLVEGVATSSSSNSPTSQHVFLRSLSSYSALPTSTRDFTTIIDLCHVLLSFRNLESKIFGKALDSNARGLLDACSKFKLHLQHLKDNPSLLPHAATFQPEFYIQLSKEKKVKATAEQLDIISSPTTPGITLIISHAGSGKTTACLGLAQAMGHSQVFSVFGSTKRPLNELRERFGNLATFNTVDSLAYHVLKARYGDRYLRKFQTGSSKTSSELRELDWVTVGKLLGIYGEWMPRKYRRAKSGGLVALLGKRYLAKVLRTFETWCNSSRHEISSEDIRRIFGDEIRVPSQEIIKMTRKLASRVFDMEDPTAPLPFFAMKKKIVRDLDSEDIDFTLQSVILVDEAQDLNTCELEMFLKIGEGRRLVLAGDPLQAIYQFKGTTDRWARLPNADVFHLNQSLRFGEEITSVINEPLIARGRIRNLVVGSSKPSQVYRLSDVENRRDTLKLDPSYKALFLDVLNTKAHSANKSLCLQLLLSDRFDAKNPLQLFFHGAHLRLGVPFKSGSLDHPYPQHDPDFSSSLADFRSWEEFIKEFDSWSRDLPGADKYRDWGTLVEVFSRGEQGLDFAKQVLESRAALKEVVVPETQPANMTMSIPWQIKGLEADSVQISESFGRGFHAPAGSLDAGSHHTALSRARQTLELNSKQTEKLAEIWGLHRFYSYSMNSNSATSESACENCGSASPHAPLIGYSTTLPYHPRHVHPLISNFRSQSASSISISSSNFPICVDCAARSRHLPLRNFARYLAGQPEEDQENSQEITVKQALSRRREMKRNRMNELRQELELDSF